MIILDTTTRKLELVLAAAPAANQLPFVASYVDISQSSPALTAASTNTSATNSTTAVTAVAAPGASTSRQLKFLSIQNADTAAATVTVRVNDNSTLRIVFKATLAVGDQICFTDAEGFSVLDSTGALKQVLSSQLSSLNISGLTASQAVFTDGSKNLVSNAITGSGNVVMSTSPVLVTPNLGIPSALVGTNITGTAAGLTAGNVTTNANLTGPITSVGNATAIASQTGTGTTFVMSASPTLTGTANVAALTASGTVTPQGLVDISGASAGQIKFPATQNASANANTLDDYEEGTWTGTLHGSTTDPSSAVTATGNYTKVGNVVTISVVFVNVDTTGAAGDVTVSGGPFTATAACFGTALNYLMFAAAAGYSDIISWYSGTTINLYNSGFAIAWSASLHNAGAGRYLYTSVTYLA